MEDSLLQLLNQAKGIAAKRLEDAQICFDIGFSLQQLSKLETSTKQHSTQTKENSNLIRNDGNFDIVIEKSRKFFERVSDKQKEQGFNLQEVFENQIRNLYRNVQAMQEAIGRRQAALDKLIASEQALESAKQKQQKGVQIQLRSFQEAITEDKRSLQEISRTLIEEVEIFNVRRQKDMVNILNDFQNLQKKQAENLLEIWNSNM